MKFIVATTHREVSEDSFVLERDRWDDFGYRCTFRVYLIRDRKHELVGEWKILDSSGAGARTTELPNEFEQLPPNYISLGQQLEFYRNLRGMGRSDALSLLNGLRDVVFRPLPKLRTVDGFETALVRFASASEALKKGPGVLKRLKLISRETSAGAADERREVTAQADLIGFSESHKARFSFSRAGGGLGRIVVLIGSNGSGKTQFLAALAKAMSGMDKAAAKLRPSTPFSNAIAVSYGAFDRFTRPKVSGKRLSYTYCGLRAPPSRADDRVVLDLEAALVRASRNIISFHDEPKRLAAWDTAMKTLGLREVARKLTGSASGKDSAKHLRILSAGQQLAIVTVSDLAHNLRDGSIVLYDEPETHMHPRMLSRLLTALRFLLEIYDSFAIVATHSLIPAQEAPSTNVLVLRTSDAGDVSIATPPNQTFGATLDEIERTVFGAGENDINFREILRLLVRTKSKSEIKALLGGEFGLGVELALLALEK